MGDLGRVLLGWGWLFGRVLAAAGVVRGGILGAGPSSLPYRERRGTAFILSSGPSALSLLFFDERRGPFFYFLFIYFYVFFCDCASLSSL